MVKTAISFMKFTSPLGLMLGAAGEYLADTALDKVYDVVEEELDKNAGHILAYGLQKAQEKDNQVFEKVKEMPPKEAIEYINGKSP